MRVHNREIAMYQTFFDLLRQFRSSAGLSADQIPLDVPAVYYTHEDLDGSGTVMIMEDLRCEGFGMIDKINGSDYEHATLALTSLAHYHALSIAFVRKYVSADGSSVDYPAGAEFLAEKSAFEDIVDIVHQWIKTHIELMRKMDREDVWHCVQYKFMSSYNKLFYPERNLVGAAARANVGNSQNRNSS